MMTEACGATNCTMMEVGKAISRMMKVCGATKSTLSKVSGNLIDCGNRCETVYFRRTILKKCR